MSCRASTPSVTPRATHAATVSGAASSCVSIVRRSRHAPSRGISLRHRIDGTRYQLPNLMNLVPLALYGVALIAYAWHFARTNVHTTTTVTRNVAAGRAATTLLVFAALAHTFVIGMQTVEYGHVPVAGPTSAISTFVWLLAVAYLYTEMTTDERAMGVFILPLIVALQVIPALKPDVEARSSVLRGPLFGIHVSSLLLAYASFALACVLGITYVLLFKEIKAKHLGFFYARIPSLQVLDTMNQRAI